MKGSDRAVNGSAVLFGNFPGLTEKSTEISQNNRFLIRDLNPAPSDYETGVLRCFDR